jgi:hypothetical protein
MIECARCGYQNDGTSRFCASCGFALREPQVPIAPACEPTRSRGDEHGQQPRPLEAEVSPVLKSAPEPKTAQQYSARTTHQEQEQPEPGAPPVLVGFLVGFDADELGCFWPVRQGRMLVGRAQAAEGVDIAIPHNATSARHANLVAFARPNRVMVQDLGSTNGTFVNDQRVEPGSYYRLAQGDHIRFGSFNVSVLLVT